MSQRNIDLFRRGAEAINARVVPEGLLAPDFRMEKVETAVTNKTYHGEAGWRHWLSDFFEVFEQGARFEDEIIADGDDFVVAKVRLVGSGARSGAPLELRWTVVLWFQDGKATRSVSYASPREALEAVGLRD